MGTTSTTNSSRIHGCSRPGSWFSGKDHGMDTASSHTVSQEQERDGTISSQLSHSLKPRCFLKKVFLYLAILSCSAALTGCAQYLALMDSNDKSLAPIENYQNALEPDLRFLGKVSAPVQAGWESNCNDASLENESIVYGEAGSEGTIRKLLVVRTYKVRGKDSMVLPRLDLDRLPLLDSGSVRIASRQFDYKLLLDQGTIGKDEKKLIGSKGLSTTGCYFLKTYSGRLETGLFVKSVSHILYYESVDASNQGAACRQLIESPAVKNLVNDFSATADGLVRKLISTGSTSGGASENDIGKAPGEKINPEIPAQGQDELERKLTTLKGLLDKGLITQEDYDRKKEELLEDF